MSHLPRSPKQKRYARRITLFSSVLFGVLFAAVDAYGTYTAFQLPTIIEAIGLLLIIGFSMLLTLGIVILPNIDEFTIDNPIANRPITVITIGLVALILGIDGTLFTFQISGIIAAEARENQALVTLFFSGLLVLLYYDQHRVQRQQVELMDQQVRLSERRTEWQEDEQRPQLRVNNWNFYRDIVSLSDDTQLNESIEGPVPYVNGETDIDMSCFFTAQLSNQGRSTARSLHLRIEVLIGSDELPASYFHLNGSFLYARTDLFRTDIDIQDQYLKRENVKISDGELTNVIGVITIHSPAKADDPIRNVGDLISRLPFTVEDVVLRASLEYEGPIGKEYSEPIAAARLPVDELNDLATAFSDENLVGVNGIGKYGNKASQSFFEREFADISEHNGVVSITYELQNK